MEIVLTIVHLLACLILILVVLIQKGKGADLAGAFGGGGSQASIGVRTATQLIHKMTIGAAIFFMLTSYTLGLMGGSGQSLIETTSQQVQQGKQAPGDNNSAAGGDSEEADTETSPESDGATQETGAETQETPANDNNTPSEDGDQNGS